MATETPTRAADLHEEDFDAWVQEQVKALRKLAASGAAPADLDLPNLIEEVEELTRSEHRALESRVIVALRHLLKLEFSPAAWPRAGWRGTVITQRTHLSRRLSPNLQRHLRDQFDELYRSARIDAAKELKPDGIALDDLPAESPYTLDQVIEPDWWPRNRHGLGNP